MSITRLPKRSKNTSRPMAKAHRPAFENRFGTTWTIRPMIATSRESTMMSAMPYDGSLSAICNVRLDAKGSVDRVTDI